MLSEAGYSGAMNIESEGEFCDPVCSRGEFTEVCKRGFALAYEFLKTSRRP